MRRSAPIHLWLSTCLLAACSSPAPAPVSGTTADAAPPAITDAGPLLDNGPTRDRERTDYGATVIELPEPRAPEDEAYDQAPPETDWTPMQLPEGEASISCDRDYATAGDGVPLASLGFSNVWKTLQPCQDSDVVRVRYTGKVDAGFTALVQRVADMADTLGITSRILDIDSTGGQVEEGVRAGDSMAEGGWLVWVREDSVCHSSCVLILAAGDMRMVSGPVGIHRMLRIGSKATSRAELNQELREIHEQVGQYLQRNGAATQVADLMMTVPNRSLRLLTPAELSRFGLSGRNAAEDDLDRIRLGRKCGDGFVRRKDSFFRDYDMLCSNPGDEVADMGQCGRDLKSRYGFPDAACPNDGPMPEYD